MLVAGGVVLAALAGTGLGMRAAEAGPFAADRLCWGAWAEGTKSPFLLVQDDGLRAYENAERPARQETPSRERPRGSCVVTASDGSPAKGSEPDPYRLRATLGPVPVGKAERVSWLSGLLDARSVPLPRGLPGVVSESRGLFVLPKGCARQGRPAVVTLRAADPETDSFDKDAAETLASLLVSAANRGAELAGCEPKAPWPTDAPVLALPQGESDDSSCGIAGLGGEERRGTQVESTVSAVSRSFQACGITEKPLDGDPDVTRRYAMVARPGLVRLFDGMTTSRPLRPGWRGTGRVTKAYALARARCGSGTAVFLGSPGETGRLGRFADAVADRLGCPPVASREAGR
ncbi:hypothetical protein GCM10009801_78320 [Streptomyces albiaxialis]|uniref:Uncharacterized protein n=2 Tax=Streptomyces albiaxialis TaxID=329523 RepID=A0ABP5IRK2_9ACTN